MQLNTCGALIKHINCVMQKNGNNNLREADMTLAQLHLLFTLRKQPEGFCSLKELERLLGVAQSTTVGLVKRSSEKKLVECFGTSEDRRVKTVQITEKGLQACRDAEEFMALSEEMLLKNLTQEERKTLIALLTKVYQSASEAWETK